MRAKRFHKLKPVITHDDLATKDPLGPDSQQAASLSSHTDKTVEDKGIGEEGWGEVKGVEYDYWVGREGSKIFYLHHIGAMLVERQLKPLRPKDQSAGTILHSMASLYLP